MNRFILKFKDLFATIFGNLTWNPPYWLNQLAFHLKQQYNKHPFQVLAWMTVSVGVFTAATAGYMAYRHYQQQPHVIAMINPLRLTMGKGTHTDPLTIQFSLADQNRLKHVSAAPLALIGKKFISGIQMSPTMAGEWEWLTEDLLTFAPKESWPAGQKYQVSFKKELLSDLPIRRYQYEFATPPLAGKISELQLYQDPNDPLLLKVIATINFNYPVDSFSIEKNSQLLLQHVDQTDKQTSQNIPLKASYDNKSSTVYLESAPIKLSELAQYVSLTVEKGVSAAYGPGITQKVISQKLLLPNVGSFLKINHVEATIERDAKDQPMQVVIVNTSAGISREELMKYLHVYVLPTDYPAASGKTKRKNYAWSRPGEVTENVLEGAVPLELEPLAEKHPSPTEHRFKFNLPASKYAYLQIAKGMSAAGGFSLKQDYTTVFSAPEFPQEIHFRHKGSLLALAGDRTLAVGIRGIPEIKVSIYQILPAHINHLITQTYGKFHSPQFLNSNFGPEAISQLYCEYRQFENSNACELNYTVLDIGSCLKASENPLGFFLVKVQAWDSKQDIASGVEENRLILITDMSLIVKDNSDHTHDVFVHSITQGEPVSEAQISLMGKNGQPLFKGATDEQGRLTIPSVKDFKDDREPAFYLVTKESDISFIPFDRYDRKINYSRFDVGGASTIDEDRLYAYLFSERGMYRPGETWHIGMIVKERFGKAPLSGLPLEAVVKDPQGKVLHKQKFTLPDSNLMLLDYAFAPSAPSGHYYVGLYIAKGKHSKTLLGDYSVQVAEFTPDRLKIDIALKSSSSDDPIVPAGWMQPSGLKANINLKNLFGLVAANHRIEGKITISPCCLQFPQYSGYNFVDPWLDPKKPIKSYSKELTALRTDPQGEAEFTLLLDQIDKAAFSLSFLAEGFEGDSGHGVKAEVSTLVSPLEYLIGYKAEDQLRYLKQHSPQRLHFIAINPQQNTIPVKDLKLKIFAHKTTSALVKKRNGTYRYQSVIQEVPISEQPFEIKADGTYVDLPTDEIGDFSLHLTAADGMLLSKANFSVIGSSNKSLAKKSELNLKLDKSSYDPGESIELQITAPFAGTGLITIERDKTYVHHWFKTESTTSVQKITIPNDFQGNGYVNVAFVRSWDSDEIFVNPLSTATVPFNVSHKPQTLQTDLSVPPIVRAGEPLHIQYKTDQPAKIILYAADEGILQLSDHQTPDPLAYFFQKQALGVVTSQTADLILPKQNGEQELSSPGGDRHIQPSSKHLNPFKHTKEKSVVFCSGILDTGPNLQTETVQLPDYFNGKIRVMAVAVSENCLGNASDESIVQADFVIHPNIGSFIAPGDRMVVTASIANCRKDSVQDASVIVQLKTSKHFEILDSPLKSITIPHKQQCMISFEIKSLDALGEGLLTFEVTNQDEPSEKTTRTLALSVRPASAHKNRLISGYDASPKKSVQLEGNFFPEHHTLKAAVSTSPLILAQGLQEYLKSTPELTTEQIISKAISQTALRDPQSQSSDKREFLDGFRRTVQLLRERQTDSGGFSLWPDKWSTFASEGVSILAADFLLEAAQQEYPVPDDMLAAVMCYLEDLVQSDVGTLSEAHLHAHAIYLLTRNGLITTNYLTNLQSYLFAQHKQEWKRELLSTYIAATYALLQDKIKAKELSTGYSIGRIADDQKSNEEADVTCKHAQHITLLARHFPEKLREISGDAILALVQKLNPDSLNTLTAGWCVRALAACADPKTIEETSIKMTAVFPNSSEVQLSPPETYNSQVNIDPLASSLNFYNPVKQLYFFQIHQAGFIKSPVIKPEVHGIEIFREYIDSSGQATNYVKCGDKVTVQIKARSLNQQRIGPVIIADLFPAGFELIAHSIAAEGCDCVDVREDRILFYCAIDSTVKSLSYSLQAVNVGEFAIPPISAQAIDRPEIHAQGTTGRMSITRVLNK